MRLLVLCHEFPPIGGGAAAVCAALSAEYVRAGHEVSLVTMGFGDLPAEEPSVGLQVHRIACGRRRKEMASAWEGLAWARAAWPVIARLQAQTPFDAVHSHFIMPGGILARRMKRTFGIPYLITPHGSDVPGFNRERLKWAHLLARPWWKRIARQAAWIVSPSHSLLQLIQQTAPLDNCTVIPNGFQPGKFQDSHKQQRILLCSRLVERKGFQYFLEALGDLELPGWEVDLVGDGPMFQRLEQLAKSCRIPVHLHGWLDNNDPRLAALYGQAMIFSLPSEWENFSVALLEGMSAGCAVLTTNISGNPEAVGNTGYLVPPADVPALRQAILELTADAARCQALGKAAADRAAREFDWAIIAGRYLNLFQGMTAGASPSRIPAAQRPSITSSPVSSTSRN